MDRADVVARLQKVRGEAALERVATDWLSDPSFADGAVDIPLQNVLIYVMALDWSGAWID